MLSGVIVKKYGSHAGKELFLVINRPLYLFRLLLGLERAFYCILFKKKDKAKLKKGKEADWIEELASAQGRTK